MADSDRNPVTNADNHSNIENEPKGLNGLLETDTHKEEYNEADVKEPEILKSNSIIQGECAPEVAQNDSVGENRPNKRISTKELKFLGVTEIKEEEDEYSVFGDNENIYKKYRLRESVNKPNYKIPSISDIPEIEEKPLTFRPVARMFPCPYCNKENENKIELRYHIRSAHNIKYTCSQCFETFESNEKLITHKEIHETENQSHICDKCKVAFSNHFDYLYHKLIKHTHSSTFKCAECGLTYNRSSFQTHMITHFKRVHSCPKCSKKFMTEIQLKDHLNSHDTPSKTYQCVECDKILKGDKKTYEAHMAIHTGFKPHQCLYCGKGFRTSGQKKVHTRIHTQERPFACTKCDKKFIQSIDLQRHLIGHDKVKNYKCEICQKNYINKFNLKLHMRIHSKKFDCPDCGKSFPSPTNLRNHALYQHSTERLVECKACNKSFATNSHLSKHKSTKGHKRQEFRLKLERETEI